MEDSTNPDHYKTGGIEAIDVIEAKLSVKAFRGYLNGNILKYIMRYENKNGVEDLRKAQWYLNRLIKVLDPQESTERGATESLFTEWDLPPSPPYECPPAPLKIHRGTTSNRNKGSYIPQGAYSYRPFDNEDDTPEC